MNTANAIKSVSLFYKDGSSDKEYHASIETSGEGFVVNFAYGRRGSTLATGTKTQSPVPLDKATKVFEKLVAEKTAKGYTPSAGGVAFAGTQNAGRVSGHQAQLLNPIDEPELEALFLNPEFVAQEKFDGERRAVVVNTTGAQGINRKGLFVALPEVVAAALVETIPAETLLDAEQVGDILHVFDITRSNGVTVSDQPYRSRLEHLARTVTKSPSVRIVKTAITTAEKRALYADLQSRKAEGIVFKRVDAPYVAGRPNSGGSQLKYKFVDSAQVIVQAHNDKRSVQMAVVEEGGGTSSVGSVTIPPNKPIPAIGNIIEVQYLYAFPNGSLFQPVYLGERTDLSEADCNRGQLKYKPV